MRVLILLITACWLLLAPQAEAQEEAERPSLRLLLEVRDSESRIPLPGARVRVDSLTRVTNADGRALFREVQAGEVTVSADFLGYALADTVMVLDRSVRLTFLLQPAPISLETVEVEAERFNTARLNRVGFYRRRDVRTGVFFTIEDIEKRGATSFSDIFRGVPGLRIESNYGRAYLTSTRRNDCSPAIFLDGTRARGLEEFLDSVTLRDVLAVEVYRGPSEVPVQFSASINGTECGAVLVWTRAR